MWFVTQDWGQMVLDCLLLFCGLFQLFFFFFYHSSCPCHDPNIRLLDHYFPSSSSCHTSGNSPAFFLSNLWPGLFRKSAPSSNCEELPFSLFLSFSLSLAPAHSVPSSSWQQSGLTPALTTKAMQSATGNHGTSAHLRCPLHRGLTS